MNDLDEYRNAHNKSMRPIVITILAVCLIGAALLVGVQRSDGAVVQQGSVSTEQVAPQVHLSAKAGCDFTPRVCSVLDRTNQMWRQLRNGGCGQCDYTSGQLDTIRNNTWLNKMLVATSQLRNPHSQNGWNIGDRGFTGKSAKAAGCAAGATPWEFWAWHREPSMFGLSTLYEFHYHADVCFRFNSSTNNWNVMSISSDTWTEDRDCVNCTWGGSVLDHRSNVPDTWVQDIRTEKVAAEIKLKYGFVNNMDPQTKWNIFGPSHYDLTTGY